MPPRQRVTPSTGLTPAEGRVAARPTDPFLQFTGNAAGSQLRDLARSLSRFGEQGSRFAGTLQRRQQEEDTAAGRTAFLEALEEQKSVRKALAALEMRPQQSQWFRWAVQAEAGKADAMRARDYFVAAKDEALKEATTLDEFDELAAAALDEYRAEAGETSEAFDNGFFPSYMAMIENERYSFAQGLDGKLQMRYLDNFEARLSAQMDASGDDREGLAAYITLQLDAANAVNPLPAFNKAVKARVVELLITRANELQDPSYLDLAEQIGAGPTQENGKKPALKHEFRTELEAARREVISNRASYERNMETLRVAEVNRQVRGIESAVTDRLLAGGDRADVVDLIAEAERLDIAAGSRLRNAIENRESFADFTDPDTFEALEEAIWAGQGDVAMILSHRGRLSLQAVRTLKSDLEAYERSQQDGTAEKSILSDPRVMDFVTGVSGGFGVGPANQLTADKGNRIRIARNQLRSVIVQNAAALAEMSFTERERWLAEQQDIVIKRNTGEIQGRLVGVGNTPMESNVRIWTDDEVVKALKVGDFIQMADLQDSAGAGTDPRVLPEARRFMSIFLQMRPDLTNPDLRPEQVWAEINRLATLHHTRITGGGE